MEAAFVSAACDLESPPAAAEAAQRALEGELVASPRALLQLVGALGPLLTSTDARVRARGTDCLARALGALRGSPVEPSALQHLVRFFGERLDDLPCITASLRGARALAERADLAPAELAALTSSLSGRVHVPSLPQPERLAAYEALRALVEVHARAVCRLGLAPALALGVAKAADGEKDPRNLVRSFALLGLAADALVDALAAGGEGGAEAARDAALDSLRAPLDELFDVLSCYFPIRFSPPKKDTVRISEAQLRDAWHAAAGARALGARTARMLADVLSDAAVPPKLDAARALGACARGLGRRALAPEAPRLGGALGAMLGFSQGAEGAMALFAFAQLCAALGSADARASEDGEVAAGGEAASAGQAVGALLAGLLQEELPRWMLATRHLPPQPATASAAEGSREGPLEVLCPPRLSGAVRLACAAAGSCRAGARAVLEAAVPLLAPALDGQGAAAGSAAAAGGGSPALGEALAAILRAAALGGATDAAAGGAADAAAEGADGAAREDVEAPLGLALSESAAIALQRACAALCAPGAAGGARSAGARCLAACACLEGSGAVAAARREVALSALAQAMLADRAGADGTHGGGDGGDDGAAAGGGAGAGAACALGWSLRLVDARLGRASSPSAAALGEAVLRSSAEGLAGRIGAAAAEAAAAGPAAAAQAADASAAGRLARSLELAALLCSRTIGELPAPCAVPLASPQAAAGAGAGGAAGTERPAPRLSGELGAPLVARATHALASAALSAAAAVAPAALLLSPEPPAAPAGAPSPPPLLQLLGAAAALLQLRPPAHAAAPEAAAAGAARARELAARCGDVSRALLGGARAPGASRSLASASASALGDVLRLLVPRLSAAEQGTLLAHAVRAALGDGGSGAPADEPSAICFLPPAPSREGAAEPGAEGGGADSELLLPLLAAACAAVPPSAPGAAEAASQPALLALLARAARAPVGAGAPAPAGGAHAARDALCSIGNKWPPAAAALTQGPLALLALPPAPVHAGTAAEEADSVAEAAEAAEAAEGEEEDEEEAAFAAGAECAALHAWLALMRGLYARGHPAAADAPRRLLELCAAAGRVADSRERAAGFDGAGGPHARASRREAAAALRIGQLAALAVAALADASSPSALLLLPPRAAGAADLVVDAVDAADAGPLPPSGGAVVSPFRAQRLLCAVLPALEQAGAPGGQGESGGAGEDAGGGRSGRALALCAVCSVACALPLPALSAHAPRVAAALARALARAWGAHVRALGDAWPLPPPPPPALRERPRAPCEALPPVRGLLAPAAVARAALGALAAVQRAQAALAAEPGAQDGVGARLSEHAASLLDLLAALGARHGSMAVRLCALECIDGLRLLPYAALFPLRAQVADKLKPALADRKRRVRVAAAGVRSRWFESAGAGAE